MSVSHILPLTTDEILEHCPRFRILLVGKSGAGKSSLINYAFNVNIAAVSNQKRGIADINTEIISPQNDRFVLHDSLGFEHGETGNLQKVKDFLTSRGEGVNLRDRVHAIWHCIEVPHAGGRVFETGDERLLEFAKVPIVVVFTKFDRLVSRMDEYLSDEELEMPEEDIQKLCIEKARVELTKLCLKPLEDMGDKQNPRKRYAHATTFGLNSKIPTNEDYRPNLANLIDLTQNLVHENVEGDVWLVSAMAQRASAEAKINSSIEIGMKKYWQDLASSTSFSDSTLERCLATIHRDITASWNFNDPNNLLNSEDFQKKMCTLTQLVTPESKELNSWFNDLDRIQALIGVGTVFTAVAAPVIAAIGLSVMFVKWIARLYQKTPEVLRCLMAYIVNLTLVLDQLFLCTLAIKPPRQLTEEQVDMALESYKTTEASQVHREIREYVSQAPFSEISKSNTAQKAEQFILHHRGGIA